jgi:4'-phosphopantetheinyl transferase
MPTPMPVGSADAIRLESLLQKLLQEPRLQLNLNPTWGSDLGPQHRKSIREALSQNLRNPDFLNLDTRPQSPGFSISISHAPTIGGYAAVPKPLQIGLDVELTERVSPRTIGRMSDPTELAQAPHPSVLWVAKEAVFKALDGPGQPKTLRQLTLGDWLPQEHHQSTWTFHARHHSDLEWFQGLGAAIQTGGLSLAVFLFSPQL